MAGVSDTQGVVFKNGTATLMARVVGADAANILQADIQSATYSVYRLDESDADSLSVVTGHDGQSLAVNSIIFDSLQLDAPWTTDAVGYNFRHQIDISSHPAFAVAGPYYQVRYQLTPTSGQAIIVRFKLRVI